MKIKIMEEAALNMGPKFMAVPKPLQIKPQVEFRKTKMSIKFK
jgi:hypothetical protein